MNESILNSLMNLYALIAYANKASTTSLARNFVESYLKQNYSKKITSNQLDIFDLHIKHISETHKNNEDLKSYFSIQVVQVCEQINKELHQKQKLLVLINALQFIKYWRAFSVAGFENEKVVTEILETISLVFNFNKNEFSNIKYFIYDKLYKIADKQNILAVRADNSLPISGINTYIKKGITGNLFIYYVETTNTYLFKYTGKEKLELSGKKVFSNQTYLFDKGTSLSNESFIRIYYSEIVSQYLIVSNKLKIVFDAKNIAFNFPNSENGIKEFSFTGYSGQLIGVMGGSGSGKSTLLNVLNGNLELAKGEILINNHNISIERKSIEGIIGYIPQDDLLIEELTVYQNLYYNTKLCFDNLPDEKIHVKIQNLLVDLDLWDSKDLKVGTPLKKYISGGQRKRLNIALELIRKPSVLFVDEPTSGLSSADSKKVVELLKEESLKGNFLVVNIHQPSSVIFKQFDKLIILDKGGYPIYFGDPIDAVGYFKKFAKRVDADENECHCCGNVNPDTILELVELTDIDEFGEYSKERKIEPIKWYKNYKTFENDTHEVKINKRELPVSNFKVPNKWNQFIIFSKRNFFTKLADTQYLLISLLVTPVLAVVLSFLIRYLQNKSGNSFIYSFIDNENIPAYIFMSTIVVLFIGLIVSAEEIFHDKKILKREFFLNLSQLSYYNSKIIFLFFISAIQALSYVLLGNFILEIKGMTFSFWIVLFSLSCFSNIVGLNISSAFKSAVTIYIIIPLILVPQILLGGVIVEFDKLNNLVANEEYVPVIGDFIASRWAYEAMMVTQFKENEFEKTFFDIEQRISQESFLMNYKIPRLLNIIDKIIREKNKNSIVLASTKTNIELLSNEINNIHSKYKFKVTDNPNLSFYISILELKEIKLNLKSLKLKLAKHVSTLIYEKDDVINELGMSKVLKLKQDNYNTRVSEFVLNSREITRIKQTEGRLVQDFEPIYLQPNSKIGRSHLFAPYKTINNTNIPTLWFNVIAIWVMTIFMYIMLYFNVLKRVVEGKLYKIN